MHILLRVNAILSVSETNILADSAMLSCVLSCFSPKLQCAVSKFTTNNMDVTVASTIGHVTGTVNTYSYPTQTITLGCLNSSTTYNYCVVTINTNMVKVGKSLCGNFTTLTKVTTISENNDGMYVASYILSYSMIYLYTAS